MKYLFILLFTCFAMSCNSPYGNPEISTAVSAQKQTQLLQKQNELLAQQNQYLKRIAEALETKTK